MKPIDKIIDALFEEANRIKYSQEITNMKRCCREQLGNYVMELAKMLDQHINQAVAIEEVAYVNHKNS